jgi:hypothetical protein
MDQGEAMSYEVSAGEFAHPRIGQPAQPASAALSDEASAAMQDERELSFWDFLDLVNPLQHIPVVSTLYREITGDEISAPMRTLGGLLFAGPVGFVNGIVNGIVEEASGRDVGGNFFAFFNGGTEGDLDSPATASAKPPIDDPAAVAVNRPPAAIFPPPADTPTTDRPNARLEPKGDTTTANAPLSGTAALQAFLSDLGAAGVGMHESATAGTDTITRSAPVAPARFYALPARAAKPAVPIGSTAPDSAALGPDLSGLAGHQPSFQGSAVPAPTAAPDESMVADRMLEALQKYETMAERRRAAGQGG